MAMIANIAKANPMAFGVGFSCAKTSISDLVVQVLIERRTEIDWKRNAAFASFGFGYLGIVQYSLYVPVFKKLFPKAEAFAAKSLRDKAKDIKGQGTVIAQVFLDQCVHHPFMYFPAFYMTKELVCMGSDTSVTKVYERWSENFWPDLFALWKIWVPASMLNFAFSPMWLRIPVVASTSLVWTMILSTMRGGADETSSDVNSEVLHDKDEERAGEVMLGFGGVDARSAELFAQGLARRVSNVEEYVEGSEIVRALTRRVTPAESSEPTLPVNVQGLAHLCVTASGRDRVGLVTQLSTWIYDRGGSITGSKMLRMNDDFTVVMHVISKDRTSASHLRADLLLREGAIGDLSGLHVTAREIKSGGTQGSMREARVRCTGYDRPGIVYQVTEVLASAGFNIDELTTDTIRVAGKDGATRPFFLLEGVVTAPDKVPVEAFEKKLEGLRSTLDAKITVTWT